MNSKILNTTQNIAEKFRPPVLPDSVVASEWLGLDLAPPEPVIEGLFDKGDKAMLSGASKSRKTTFVMGLGISIAAGKPMFLNWPLRRMRVGIFQFEVTEGHYHRRMRRICKHYDIGSTDLGDYLHIVNARGSDLSSLDEVFKDISAVVRAKSLDLVVIDPAYKLLEEENLSEGVKPLLRKLDILCKETGVAVLVVHHYAKGASGDKQAVDRSVGSGVWGRDMDALICLDPHQEPNLYVCEQVCRAYPPCDPFSIRLNPESLIFELDDAVPVVKSKGRCTESLQIADAMGSSAALKLASESGTMTKSLFVSRLTGKGVSERCAKRVLAQLVVEGKLVEYEQTLGRIRYKYMGFPSAIDEMRKKDGGTVAAAQGAQP